MIEAPHYSAAGASKKAVALPEALFDGTVNEDVLHRAVITYLSNQRQGTSNTLTRSEVSGGNQKPWRQKGTGRARQGSTRAPHWRHGGIAHGPHPRSYRLGIPKKMRQLAKKSALNARARESSLVIVDTLEYQKPKTKDLGVVQENRCRQERSGAHRRRLAQRVPLGPQHPRRARDAVRRRDGIRNPLGAHRGGGAGRVRRRRPNG